MKNVPIQAYLDQQGIPYTVEHGRLRSTEHDSLIFTLKNNSFYWNSRQGDTRNHGDLGNFIAIWHDVDNKEAFRRWKSFTQEYLGISDEIKQRYAGQQIDTQANYQFDWKKWHLADADSDIQTASDYLTKIRGLNPNFIKMLHNQGIFEQGLPNPRSSNEVQKVGALIFPWRNENGEVVGADIQGTIVDYDAYGTRGTLKRVAAGSDEQYGHTFHTGNGADKLVVFEAPIDALSYVEMKWESVSKENVTFLSMSGTKSEKVMTQLLRMNEQNGHLPKEVVIATDNDEAGHNVADKLMSMSYEQFSWLREVPSIGKDWNEQLQQENKVSVIHQKERNSSHKQLLYHGSPVKFDEFEIQRNPNSGTDMGFGIYLTDNKERAKKYSDDGYVYTVSVSDELMASTPLSDSEVTLTEDKISEIITKVAEYQISDEGYPYILSDWDEPSSETEIDDGNRDIINMMSSEMINDDNDIQIINGLNNQLGGADGGARILGPILNEVGIHYAVRDFVDETAKERTSQEYVIFNPKELTITQVDQRKELNQSVQNEITREFAQTKPESGITKKRLTKDERQQQRLERKREIYRENEATIQKALEKIKNYKEDPAEIKKYLDFVAQGLNYSGNNTQIIYGQRPDATVVMGYEQFQQRNIQVNKGEKAIKIFGVPQETKYISLPGNKQIAWSKATPQQKEDAQRGEYETYSYQHYPILSVFDVKQTNATEEDLPLLLPNRPMSHETDLSQPELDEIYQILKSYAEVEQNIQVIDDNPDAIQFLSQGRSMSQNGIAKGAFIRPKKKEARPSIVLRNDLPVTDRIGVLAHELGHASLHLNTNEHTHPRHIKELQAEMTSYVVLTNLGIDPGKMSERYMNDWTNGLEKLAAYKDHQGTVLEEIAQASTPITRYLSQKLDNNREIQSPVLNQDMNKGMERLR